MKLQLFICVLIASHLATAGDATSTEFDALLSEGNAHKRSGDYRQAVLSFREALTIADGSQIEDRRILGILDVLASAEADAGQVAEAAYHYRRALLLLERTSGQHSIDYALLLGSLTTMWPQGANTKEAVSIIRKAVDTRIGSTQQLNSLRAYLFRIYEDQKQYSDAEAIILEEQADFDREREHDPLQKATLLNNLGVIRYRQKRYKDAIALNSESVSIRETALGYESPTLIEPLNNLASSLFLMKHFEAADRNFYRAISLCDKTLGAAHPTCSTTLANYAVVLNKGGRKNVAKAAARVAEEARKSKERREGLDSIVDVKAMRGK